MGQTTFASDIYSLGMTLIYLVTGTHPAELTQATGRVQFDTSTISDRFASWLIKATEPYIDKRYTSASVAFNGLSSNANLTVSNSKLEDFQLKSKYTDKPEYTKLKINCDRQKLEIIYLESIETSPWTSWVIVPIVVILFMSGIGGLILVIIWWFTTTIRKLDFIPQSYKFRMIAIKKNKYICFKFTNHTATKRETAWKSLSIKYLRCLPSSATHSYEIENLIFTPRYTCNEYLDQNGELIRGRNLIILDAKLSISTRHNKFSITESSSKDGRIEESELLYLAEEISDFLDLELKIVPQLPPDIKDK